MGKGILGPILERVPLPSGRRTLDLRDATNIPDVQCEIHGQDPAEVAPRFMAMVVRPGGLDVCPPCTEAVIKVLRALRSGAR